MNTETAQIFNERATRLSHSISQMRCMWLAMWLSMRLTLAHEQLQSGIMIASEFCVCLLNVVDYVVNHMVNYVVDHMVN